MPDRNDRTVHGLTRDGREIVRYDRAGRWYIESQGSRQRVRVVEAAIEARDGQWFEGRCGGMAFDAMVRRARYGRELAKRGGDDA